MKEMVQFVAGNGESFFECSTVEARMAMAAVRESRVRENWSKEGHRLKQELDTLFGLIAKFPTTKELVVAKDGLGVNFISEMFTAIENKGFISTHIFMNAIRYGDLRKWDRDCLDIEIEMWKLRAGWMASLWGAKIVVRKDIPSSDVIVVSSRVERMDDREDIVERWKFDFQGAVPVKSDDVSASILDRLAGIEEKLERHFSKE